MNELTAKIEEKKGMIENCNIVIGRNKEQIKNLNKDIKKLEKLQEQLAEVMQ